MAPPVSRQVKRLYLGHLDNGPVAPVLPLHGYVIEAGDDVVLVDSGIGDDAVSVMQTYAADWRMVVRSLDEALGDHGLCVADVTRVVSTHLHLDHFGQHAALEGIPFIVQRRELADARATTPYLGQFFDFAGADIVEMDGDEDIADGVRVLATPGHTAGHQSVVVTHDDGTTDLIVGDAAYTTAIWNDPAAMVEEHPSYHMQVGDPEHWWSTVDQLKALGASRLHFCHDPIVLA
jgi:glyoxylase-like metal-dependent hydrolase (beta-lactamase superfamily II)